MTGITLVGTKMVQLRAGFSANEAEISQGSKLIISAKVKKLQ